MLNLAGNNLQSAKFRQQIEASEPLKKQLWQQTIKAKIINQSRLLKKLHGSNIDQMLQWADEVKSGDSDNLEARAAVYYWKRLFPMLDGFKRNREGEPPNNLLNYGYAILRAIIARSLVSSGLLPTLGIYHRNQYNHYCLADDIMEPYRPFVDQIVYEILKNGEDFTVLNTSIKKQLLSIGIVDLFIDKQKSPLMNAALRTATSLSRSFEGKNRKLLFPTFS